MLISPQIYSETFFLRIRQFHEKCQISGFSGKTERPGNTKIKRSYIKELTRAQEMQSPSDGVSVPGCGQVGSHLPHRTAKPLAWN